MMRQLAITAMIGSVAIAQDDASSFERGPPAAKALKLLCIQKVHK